MGQNNRKKICIGCVSLILVLLGIIGCSPKPVWWIVQKDLHLSTSLSRTTIEGMYYEEHAPNGDGVDIIKLVIDDHTWEKLFKHLNEDYWRPAPVPSTIQKSILDDCEYVIWDNGAFREGVMGGNQIMEMNNIMNDEDVYWFFQNRYTMRYQGGKNLIQSSPNYTFGLLCPESKSLFYIKSDS